MNPSTNTDEWVDEILSDALNGQGFYKQFPRTKASGQDELDGHVNWKLAELKILTNQRGE
jgi:hypothetical protein